MDSTTPARLVTSLVAGLLLLTGFFACDRHPAQPVDLNQALMRAADKGDSKAVKLLLDRGANIEARNLQDDTPLMVAAEGNNVTLMRLLLRRGANPEAKNRNGDTALLEAVKAGSPEALVVLLEKGSNLSAKNEALLEVASSGPVMIRDPSPQTENSQSKVPVTPQESPWVGTVRILLDSGAEIETRDSDGATPLMLAASVGQTGIFKFLLERGAKMDVRDKRGATILIAASCGCALTTMNPTDEVVDILLERGADLNARDNEGTTALMNAAGGFEGPQMLQLLLDHGANLRARNKHGETALTFAIKAHRDDKIPFLKKALAQSH
jgi:ankyrin repeat protein